MSHPRAEDFWQIPHRWDRQDDKCPGGGGGEVGTLGIDLALFIILAFITYSSLLPDWEGLRYYPFKFYRR